MKALLMLLRSKNLKIAQDEFRGLINAQQAAAQRRVLRQEIADLKTKKFDEDLKRVESLQAKIAEKWHGKLAATEPQTDADFLKASYNLERAKRDLRLMNDVDLKQGLNEIKENLELYSLLPERTSLLLDEAKTRQVGTIPGSVEKIDFTHQVNELQAIMKATHFTEFYKNSTEWKDAEQEKNYLQASRAPDRIYIRNGDQLAVFPLDDELGRPVSVDEMLGRKERPWTQMDKIAGLSPPPEKPLVIGFGATDQEAQTNLEQAAAKYKG
jgi:hypothetical protein